MHLLILVVLFHSIINLLLRLVSLPPLNKPAYSTIYSTIFSTIHSYLLMHNFSPCNVDALPSMNLVSSYVFNKKSITETFTVDARNSDTVEISRQSIG